MGGVGGVGEEEEDPAMNWEARSSGIFKVIWRNLIFQLRKLMPREAKCFLKGIWA